MSEAATLIKCLPLILGLIRSITNAIKEANNDAEVRDHLLAVKKAYDAKDMSSLNDLFNK